MKYLLLPLLALPFAAGCGRPAGTPSADAVASLAEARSGFRM